MMKKKSFLLMAVVLVAAMALTAVAGAAPSDRSSTDMFWWWQDPETDDPVGAGKLVRGDKGISGNVLTSLDNNEGSFNGYAFTLWLVIFNDPTACTHYPAPCIEDDLFNEDVMADVLYGAGNVLGSSEKGSFGYGLQAGDNSTSIAALFGMPLNEAGEGFGLIYPRTAEIHYVLRTHGPMDPAAMPSQIQTYGGGCIAYAPYGYLPPGGGSDELVFGDGDCQDIQFGINQASLP